MSINSLGPYQTGDLFQTGVIRGDLGPKDVFSLAMVCQSYNEWSKTAVIWEIFSELEGIPLVAGCDMARSRKEEFRILQPITLSSKIIGKFFGKVVGSVPPIRPDLFDKLNTPDPYESTKLCRDNYVFVVDPSCIERSVDIDTPLYISEDGSLTEMTGDMDVEQWLTIPFSVKNLRVLCKYPLNGKEYLPVFSKNSVKEAFDQHASFPGEVGIHIMRKSIIEQSRGLDYDSQKGLVEDKGFAVTPLRIRALANAIFILTSGTCPDNRGGLRWTYVRTSDTVTLGPNRTYQVMLDGFAHGVGVDVGGDYFFDDDLIGVVPGGWAEVLGPLALDKGH